MAVAITIRKKGVLGDLQYRICDFVFSGNYATGGEAITPAVVGLSTTILAVNFDGIAISTDVATGNPVKFNAATSKIAQYEGSAAGTALSEKTNAEVYATGSNVTALVLGF